MRKRGQKKKKMSIDKRNFIFKIMWDICPN